MREKKRFSFRHFSYLHQSRAPAARPVVQLSPFYGRMLLYYRSRLFVPVLRYPTEGMSDVVESNSLQEGLAASAHDHSVSLDHTNCTM